MKTNQLKLSLVFSICAIAASGMLAPKAFAEEEFHSGSNLYLVLSPNDFANATYYDSCIDCMAITYTDQKGTVVTRDVETYAPGEGRAKTINAGVKNGRTLFVDINTSDYDRMEKTYVRVMSETDAEKLMSDMIAKKTHKTPLPAAASVGETGEKIQSNNDELDRLNKAQALANSAGAPVTIVVEPGKTSAAAPL